jgi:CheY-like chemotaxis protein
MPAGGRLEISTARIEVDAAGSERHPRLAPGAYAVLAVADSGSGMSAEVRARAFEPFFTTKEHGTGLGLAIVYGIVKQHNGEIAIDSEEGRGTTFRTLLPAAGAAASTPRARAEAAPPRKHSGTLLLVEDEAPVRELMAEILEDVGYCVLVAADPTEALRLAHDHSGVIDLVVSDVVMPRMSGFELVEHLRRLRPSLDVLYVSGYTDGAICDERQLPAGADFLSKPFSPRVLAARIQQALTRRSS